MQKQRPLWRLHTFLLLIFTVKMALSQGGSGDLECGEGQSETLDGHCENTCEPGYLWCSEGYECFKPESSSGYRCQCAPGFYLNEETGSCELGKYYGGILLVEPDSTAAPVAPARKKRAACEFTDEEAKDLVDEIYKASDYFYNSSILTNEECSVSYQLIYKNVDSVNADYIKSIFNSSTEDCTNSIADNFNCKESTPVVPDIMCTDGAFMDVCDDSSSSCVSEDGNFFCSCKTGFAAPYSGSTSCLAIPCSSDANCTGHGTCEIVGNGLNNFCKCNYGFSGDYCDDPWWLIFTVLTGALGALAIGLLIGCICMSKRTKSVESHVQKDDLNLKNPFVDFQPGVRARVSSNIYNTVSDSLSGQTTQGHSNPAFNNNAYDELNKSAAQGNDYF